MNQSKNAAHRMGENEKTFANHRSDKGLISRICGEFPKLGNSSSSNNNNNNENTTTWFKNGQKT